MNLNQQPRGTSHKADHQVSSPPPGISASEYVRNDPSELSRANPSAQMGDLGQREDAPATIEYTTGTYRELAARQPDAARHEL